MRLLWAVLTPPPCLLSLPSALPIAWLPPANTPGLEGLPGRRGNFSPRPGEWQRRREQGDPPSAAGAAREQRGGRRGGSSGHAGTGRRLRGAGGTAGRREVGAYPASKPISRCFLFYFIYFITFHVPPVPGAAPLPRGGCPGLPPPRRPPLLAGAKWSSGKGRDLGDPLQIPPRPSAAGKCHHQSHRS